MRFLVRIFTLTMCLLCLWFAPRAVQAQCSGIDFTANVTTACAPALITFVTTGAPTNATFEWKFGTSTVSGTDTIDYFFTKRGVFLVSVDVIIPAVGTCTVSKSNYITINMPDTPILVVNKPLVCNAPDTVKLRNTRTGYSKVDWIVEGNNLLDKGDSIAYLFRLPGIKNIGMRVYDQFGCSMLHQFDSAVKVYYPPNITIVPNKTGGCRPLRVNFSSNIQATGRNITSYQWQFPGGSPTSSTVPNPNGVVYANSGNYNVSLTITTADGCTYIRTQQFNFFAVDSLIPQFTTSDTVSCTNEIVYFKNTSVRSQFPGDFFWSFSQGELVSDTTRQKDSLGILSTIPGLYTIELKHLFQGCLTTMKKVNVYRAIETGNNFSSRNNLSCLVPHTVNFENTSFSTSGKLIKWKFYDVNGSTVLDSSTQLNPQFTYTKEGNFNVELITEVPGKCKHSYKQFDFVKIKKPKAKLNYNKGVCLGEEVTINDGTDPFTSDTLKYKWFLWNRDSTALLKTDTNSSIQYKYNDTGYYDLSFIIYTKTCSDTLRRDSAIRVYKIKADVFPFNGPYCPGLPVTLRQKTYPAGLFNGNEWVFKLSTDTNVKVQCSGCTNLAFYQPGIYNLKYIATNNGQCGDTLNMPAAVKVGSAEVDVKFDQVTGCLPFVTKARAKTLTNFHYFNPNDSTIRYNWRIYQNDSIITDTTIAKCTSKDSVITISVFVPGKYDIGLVITNSDNCNKAYFFSKVLDLEQQTIFSIQDTVCRGISQIASNSSYGSYESYRWMADKPAVNFSPSDTTRSPQLNFVDTGYTRIVLEAKHPTGCFEYDTGYVYVNSLYLNVTSVDTFKKCAPALVNFKVFGSPGTVYYWDFGDGDTLQTEGTDIFHLYKNNSGSATDGFDVTVRGVNTTGCESFFSKPDMVKVQGPVPKFSVLQTEGCEPLQVTFINESVNLQGVYFDFGDGSPIDSAGVNNHTYSIRNRANETENIRPRMLAYDKELCFSVFESDDTIKVYRKPDAGFKASQPTACEKENITFTDTSFGSTKCWWDFYADGSIEDSLPVVQRFFPASKVSLRMYVNSFFGCKDTAYAQDFVEFIKAPVADFTTGDTVYCLKTPVILFNKTQSVYPIGKTVWRFGNTTVWEDSSTEYTTLYPFKTPGIKTIELFVADTNNCSDTIRKNAVIKVLDTVLTTEPLIKNVSVGIDLAVPVKWQPAGFISKFKEYRLYRQKDSDPFELAATFIYPYDSMWVDYSRIASTAPVTYKITSVNQCLTESKGLNPHTTVFETVTSPASGINEVKWTPYKGWVPQNYYVYKADDNIAALYKQVAVLPGSRLYWLDSNLCPQKQTYRVIAQQAADTNVFSGSNPSEHLVSYDSMPGELTINRVTVTDADHVLAEWENPYKRNGVINIVRYDTLSKWWYDFDELEKVNRYVDDRTEVNKYNYTYRIKFTDSCKVETPLGSPSRTILLKGKVVDDYPQLKWTPYLGWPTVQLYWVQLFDPNKGFVNIKPLLKDSLSFRDESLHMDIDTALVYRIMAVSGNLKDTAYSNRVRLVLEPRMFIPSAFSPNGDGLNDIFIPVSIAVYNEMEEDELQYEFSIYNRWGQRVFSTSSQNIGWDGIFNGVQAPEGVYSYAIKATGVSGKKLNYSGTVTLIR
jgi:gliding motility-associated-like protein